MTVYDEIKTERAAQDVKWGGPLHDDTHTPDHWVNFVIEHAEDAISDEHHLSAYRKEMVRVAALAVAAIESWDRLSNPLNVKAMAEFAKKGT
jgi:hypothetical protein